MKKYGFGIIGLGLIADFHAKAIKEIENAELMGAYSPTAGKAQKFCEKHSGTAYENLQSFLSNPDIDIVAIATPSGLHLDIALAILEAGKHVIIEKPIEITKDRCMKIVKTARLNSKKVAGIFPSRYHEASQLIKNAIDEGRFGTLAMADAQVKWYRSQEYYDSRPWLGTLDISGGGALMNQAIHGIDLLQWFMGDVLEVTGYMTTLTHKRIEVEDTATAILKFKNGALGVIEGTTSAYPGFLKKIEICGSKGSVILEEESIIAWKFEEEKPEDKEIIEKFSNKTETGGGASDPAAIGYEAHKKLFESFVMALENNTNDYIDGMEATKAVEIIEAIYTSAKKHTPILLPL